MFAIDDPTATSSLPTPEAAGTPGFFSEGNAGTGQPATLVRGSFLNMCMQELLNVVVAGGLTPSKTVYNQVLTAINNLISTAISASPALPSGAISHFARNTAPTGWLAANGATVSRTTYAALFSAIGTTFGVGDGSTTFGLPDLRGEFVRGWDNGRGVDTGRSFGSAQADAMQGHLHSMDVVGYAAGGGVHNIGSGSNNPEITATGSPVSDGTNATPRTAAETRPVNVALLACIKT